MSFVYWSYFPFVVVLLLVCFFLLKKYEDSYFSWIKDHWFLERSLYSKIASFLKFLAFSLLIIAMLDLRGKEEKINSEIPDQRTIILIDKSLSMLVEDVRPNRFKKALMMARHFVKRAAGHQISIIVFSDTHKRVVPFTDDIDLLDSILNGLDNPAIISGGSQLSVAIKEAVGYFSLNSDYKGGNLLVLTDGEEHDSLEGMSIAPEVNLAIVGVGTLKGGPIPIRTQDGNFRGYKRYNGEDVVSSLSESNIKNFVEKTKNSKYWISLSYSLPTEEILTFFRGRFKSKMANGEIRIRPVLTYKIIVFAIIFLCLSYIVSLRKTFVSLIVVFTFLNINSLKAQEEEKPKSALELKTDLLKEKLKNGELDYSQKLKLAENLVRLKDSKNAQILYEELATDTKQISNEALLNMTTSMIQNGEFSKAVPLFDELMSRNNLTNEQKKILENNTLMGLRQKDEKKKQKGDKKDEKEDQQDKKDQKDKNDQSDKNENSDKKEKKKQDQKNSDSSENKEKDKKNKKSSEKDQEKEDKKKNEKDKKSKNKNNEDENKEKKKSVKQKEDEIRKKRKMTKVPATLKQLMNDDRGLQKRHLKTTIGKDKRSEKKDW